MARIVGVICAFGDLGKARYAIVGTQGLELTASARQELVRIGLVSDVEDEAVTRAIEDAMQRDDLPALTRLLDEGRRRKEEVDGR